MTDDARGSRAGQVASAGPELDAARDALLADAAPDAAALAKLLARVERSVAAERGARARIRALSSPVRVLIALAAVALLVALGGAVGHGPPATSASGLLMLLPAALLLVAIVTALRPLQRPALPAWRRRLADLVPFTVLLALCFAPDLLAQLRGDAIAHAEAGEALLGGRACLVAGAVSATLAFALLRALDRGTPGSTLAAIGAGALASSIALWALCPTTAAAHLVVGHFGAALVFGAGALAVSAWLRRSAS
jgi:hypothetical protein